MVLLESKIPIKTSDVISGSLYLNLIEDFKQYDIEWKKYIQSILKQIDNLKYQIELKDWEIRVRKMGDDFRTSIKYQICNINFTNVNYL